MATYAPFGTPVTPSGTEKFRYAGEMLAGAAGSLPGLYYIGARWMDPELGRWLSLDPQLGKLSAPQTLNRYVYCVNNPLKFTDPTGLGIVSWLKNLFFNDDYRSEPLRMRPGRESGTNYPWENKGWQYCMATVGVAFAGEVVLSYVAPELFFTIVDTVGGWFGSRSGSVAPRLGGYGPQAPRVVTPVQETLDRYGLKFAESPTASWFGRMNSEYGSFEQTTLERYGLGFTESPRAAFFARMDAAGAQSSSTLSWIRGWATTVSENKASWTPFAKWGAETLGMWAISEAGRHYAETHTTLPSYGG